MMMGRAFPYPAAAAFCAVLTVASQAQQPKRLNPVIALLEQHKPVFGVYAPSNGLGRGRSQPAPPRPAIDLAKDALAYRTGDFLFNGSLEENYPGGLPAVADFFTAMQAADAAKTAVLGLARPVILKTPKIAPDYAGASERISRELNLGAAGIMFVETES